jgi:hypothetical protein
MWLAGLRDVAIVLLALESIVIGVLLALTLWQIRALARILREEIRPLLESANETATAVKGTARFVSQTVVSPLVEAASYATGTYQAIKSLFVIGRRVGHRPLPIVPAVDHRPPEASGSTAQEASE